MRILATLTAGAAFVASLVMLPVATAWADDDDSGGTVITEVFVDSPDVGQVTIMGEGFGDDPNVTFGNFGALNVLAAMDTEIVADLPANLSSGDYLLIVTRAGGYDDDDDDDDDNRASDEYDLTIGPRLDKTVFVTSTLHTGNLGGLQGADLICNQRAHEAGLSGTYKAWLADSTGAPSSRFIQSVVPYVRTDGALVAANYTDLTDGSLANPINRTESGTLAAPDVNTWTNVTVSGVAESTDDLQHCFDWTSSSSASMEGGQVGRLDRTDALWTDFPGGGVSCQNFALRLYCFEQ